MYGLKAPWSWIRLGKDRAGRIQYHFVPKAKASRWKTLRGAGDAKVRLAKEHGSAITNLVKVERI